MDPQALSDLALECGITPPSGAVSGILPPEENNAHYQIAAKLFPESAVKDHAFRQRLKTQEAKSMWAEMWITRYCDLRRLSEQEIRTKLLTPPKEGKKESDGDLTLKAFLLASEQNTPLTRPRLLAAKKAYEALTDQHKFKARFPDGFDASQNKADFELFKDELRLYQALKSFS